MPVRCQPYSHSHLLEHAARNMQTLHLPVPIATVNHEGSNVIMRSDQSSFLTQLVKPGVNCEICDCCSLRSGGLDTVVACSSGILGVCLNFNVSSGCIVQWYERQIKPFSPCPQLPFIYYAQKGQKRPEFELSRHDVPCSRAFQATIT